MRAFWSFFLSSVWLIPWFFISLAAAAALYRRRSSWPLRLQVAGSIGTLLLTFLRSVFLWILTATQAPVRALAAAGIISNFLIFAALILFAVGYGWEKLSRRRA